MSTFDLIEWLGIAQEKYIRARQHIDESKNDPPEEPYKSKYKATEILCELDSDLNRFDCSNNFTVSMISALLNYELGVIALETEELKNCDDYFQRSWEILKNDCHKPECCVLAINLLNHLGILWCGRNEPKKACEYLTQAEMIYGEYKLGKKPCPFDLVDLFSIPKEGSAKNTDWNVLEKALTHTLYYLAQVHEHLSDSESSAKYCHITLRRQLVSGDYDPLDWSVNCATLSQYFIAKEKFSAARHVLACASHVMSEYEEKLKEEIENKEEEKWEMFIRGKADIARCWSKYAIYLLVTSRDILLKEIDEGAKEKSDQSIKDEEFDKLYRLIKESKIKELENKITCELVNDYEKARPIFLSAQEWLNQAKVYYALNEHAYDYVQILQDSSKLYKLLAFFELDIDRQCKMHKRRVDLLEEVLKGLNPQHYLALCRQLMFELAEIYTEMMDIKLLAVSTEKHNLSPHVVKKINLLANKSIEHYYAFIETLKGSKKEIPQTFSDDVARPALVAYFCLGRLYSKIQCCEAAKQLENITKSEECYKFVIKYVEQNVEHEKYIRQELPVMKEMVKLIPGKMQAIIGATVF